MKSECSTTAYKNERYSHASNTGSTALRNTIFIYSVSQCNTLDNLVHVAVSTFFIALYLYIVLRATRK